MKMIWYQIERICHIKWPFILHLFLSSVPLDLNMIFFLMKDHVLLTKLLLVIEISQILFCENHLEVFFYSFPTILLFDLWIILFQSMRFFFRCEHHTDITDVAIFIWFTQLSWKECMDTMHGMHGYKWYIKGSGVATLNICLQFFCFDKHILNFWRLKS